MHVHMYISPPPPPPPPPPPTHTHMQKKNLKEEGGGGASHSTLAKYLSLYIKANQANESKLVGTCKAERRLAVAMQFHRYTQTVSYKTPAQRSSPSSRRLQLHMWPNKSIFRTVQSMYVTTIHNLYLVASNLTGTPPPPKKTKNKKQTHFILAFETPTSSSKFGRGHKNDSHWSFHTPK